MDCDESEISGDSQIKDSGIDELSSVLASLNTNEKDDLVIGFQNICKNELSYTTARFFLEMNNW